MSESLLDARKARARTWFETLRDDICAAFEALEAGLSSHAPLAERAAGRFTRTPWSRADDSGHPGDGGVMASMQGRVFEKAGVHVSTGFGELAPQFRNDIPRPETDPPVLGLRHFAHRPSAEPACAGGAHEHALRGDHQGLVRRRRGFDPGAR